MTAPHLRPVPSAPIPIYPLGKDARLDGHSFLKWQFNRWLNSDMAMMASYEVQGVARSLFDHSQNQSPIGTLPDNDLYLSRLLRLGLPEWTEMRARPMGPLHNWTHCRVSEDTDELRLMHPVVLAMIIDVMQRREAKSLSAEDAAIRKRLERVRKGLEKLGINNPQVLEDAILIARMDDWLTRHWKSTRTRAAYEAVLVEARTAGWLKFDGPNS